MPDRRRTATGLFFGCLPSFFLPEPAQSRQQPPLLVSFRGLRAAAGVRGGRSHLRIPDVCRVSLRPLLPRKDRGAGDGPTESGQAATAASANDKRAGASRILYSSPSSSSLSSCCRPESMMCATPSTCAMRTLA